MVLLNPEQKRAVEITEGKVLVLAGAGSGKTSVLIQRCIYLMRIKQVPAKAILGLTFTNKAAEEMRSRIAKFVGASEAKEITLSTFHSFCFSILKKEIHHLGYHKEFTIYDEKDTLRVMETIKDFLAKEGTIEIKEDVMNEELLKYLKAYNAVNFDLLLSLTLELFQKFPDILLHYQNQFQYIMIDEYQDTNRVQFELADLLAKKHGNLFVVGDDDQAIYSWRGAEVKHILNFPYKNLIKLEQNYRSTQPILDTANALIQNNKERHNKSLWCHQPARGKVHLFFAPNETEEAHAVVERILKLKRDKGLKWKDFAILYRSNNLSKPFEMALMQGTHKVGDKFVRGIPYHIVQGTMLLERAEIKDLVSYLRILLNPLDQTALLRILNYPRRGISIHTIELLSQAAKQRNESLWTILNDPYNLDLTKQAKNGINNFLTLMKEGKTLVHTHNLFDALTLFVEKIGLKQALDDEFKSERAREFKWDNVLSFLQMARPLEDEKELSLYDFVNSLTLDNRFKKELSDDRVNLLTFHSAKGLEFSACFLIGIEDRFLPHEKSLIDGNIEEERRLFYVAITRAKKYLTLTMAKERTSHGKSKPTNPSRFLFEIPKELIEVESWDNPLFFPD